MTVQGFETIKQLLYKFERPDVVYQAKDMQQLRHASAALVVEVERLREALQDISKGEGTFSEDPFEHCRNTLDNMKGLAIAALEDR